MIGKFRTPNYLSIRGRLGIAILVLGALAVGAGCGGSDSDAALSSENGSDSGSTSAKNEFIEQANEICLARSREIETKGGRLFRNIATKPTPVVLRTVSTKVIIPTFERELRELETLEPPPADRRQVAAIYASIRQMIQRLKASPSQEKYPYTESEDLSAEYGIDACGRPDPPDES